MNPIPCEDYDGLKKQFFAAVSLANNRQRMLELANAQTRQLQKELSIIQNHTYELNAQIELNEQLAAYILELEKRLENNA